MSSTAENPFIHYRFRSFSGSGRRFAIFFLLQQKVPLLFGSGFKCSEGSFREVHDLHDVLSFPQHNVSSGYVKYFAVWHLDNVK